MVFILQKAIITLILPPAGPLILVLAGLVLIRRKKTVGKALLAAGLLLIYLLSLEGVADRLIRPLEAYAPPFSPSGARPDAVVVLGGGARNLSWVPVEPEPSGISLERLVKGIELARTLRVPLVVSGGSGKVSPDIVREADAMAAAAERLKVPKQDIIVENRSRNTWENAVEVRKALSGKTIVLVTSAFHMKRSAGMFRKQGFAVLPAPAGHLAETRPFSVTSIIPRANALSVSSLALSEYLSLTWYGMTGKI